MAEERISGALGTKGALLHLHLSVYEGKYARLSHIGPDFRLQTG